jgi:hypothetical protein
LICFKRSEETPTSSGFVSVKADLLAILRDSFSSIKQ